MPSSNPDKDNNPTRAGSSESRRNDSTLNPVVLELVYQKLMSSISMDVACQMHRMIKTGVYPSAELLVPKSRRDLYPQVHSSSSSKETTTKTEEERYSVFVPQRTKRKRLDDDREDRNNPIRAYLEASVAADANEKAQSEPKMEEKDEGEPSKEDSKPPANIASGTAVADGTNKPSEETTPSSNNPPPPTVSNPASAVPPQNQQQHLDIWGKAPPKEPKEMVDCLICGRQVNTLRFAPHLDKCMGIGTTVRAAALAASGFVPQQLSSSSAISANVAAAAARAAAAAASTSKS